MKHAISWFEIPTNDFKRAVGSYSRIFGIEMHAQKLENGLEMAFFPSGKGGAGGSLIHHREFYKPSKDGVLVYLDAGDDLSDVLSKIKKAGGKVLIQKRQISPEFGFMAVFLDTEGNRIALHSAH